MIEYDKANVTSSYPSLTEYEVATVLDKAYNALIAQKITGNNVRRIGFEMDLKAIEDLAPLIKQKQSVAFSDAENAVAPNVVKTDLPDDYLYFLDCYLVYTSNKTTVSKKISTYTASENYEVPNSIYISLSDDTTHDYFFESESGEFSLKYRRVHNGVDGYELDETVYYTTVSNLASIVWNEVNIGESYPGIVVESNVSNITLDSLTLYEKESSSLIKPYDNKITRMMPTKLVTHAIASKFFTSSFNIPWIKIPVSYIEDGVLYVVYDLLNSPEFNNATIVYIKTPNTFVKDLSTPQTGYITYFEGEGDAYEFECNSTVAEELISLAVAFALENVESQRLNSKLNMRGLEA